MSNHVSPRPTTDRPAQPTTYPAHPVTAASSPARPASINHSAGTDRPTSTYPTHPLTARSAAYPLATAYPLPEGWRVAPAGYLRDGDPRLTQADATPTAAFPTGRPTRRPLPRHGGAGAAHRPAAGQADAASTSRTRPGAHAVYHTASAAPLPGQREVGQAAPAQHERPVQDMWRPGLLARPSMRWHPSLMQLAIGAALVAALLGACNVAAINAHRTARAYCHALVTSDWDRAQRECRGTGSGTPTPERAPEMPDRASAAPSQPGWVTEDTGAPYSKDDPAASPLDLPRCTTAQDTPLPCLASTFPQNSNENPAHAVVLEEDASLTGLVRQ